MSERDVRFFATPRAWRRWLEQHHADAPELWVGFHRTTSGRPSITWPQAVDQALCFGWIDGVRKRIDDARYKIRFTPRRHGSTWSAINVRRVGELAKLGQMRKAGLAAFEKKRAKKSGIYSYEQRERARLDPADERAFRARAKAWHYFQSRPPWYRRTAVFWVVSAKREETRKRRLATLIGDSARGRTIAPLTRPAAR